MPQSYSYAYPSGYDRSGRHRCHCPIFPVPGGLRASAPYPSSSASDRSEGSPFPIPHERGIRLATTYDVSPLTPLPIVERDAHPHHSTLRERIVEHVFVGEALRHLWRKDLTDVEVLRPEFDAHGYDLAMVRGDVFRHIQFKTGTTRKPGDISVPLALASKPSGCVLWIGITRDLEIKSFYWFGGDPGEQLPPIKDYPTPLRATGNKSGKKPPRQNHRLVPKGKFVPLLGYEAVLEKLFGPLPKDARAG
jgi:hypothetical protein